jgi:hypothetical protein
MLNLWTTVWGSKAQAYLDLMLPSLLQPGNLPSIKECVNRYTFYVNDEAIQIIEYSELFHKLQSLVPVVIEPLQSGEWEVTSNTLHQMRLSAEEGQYMMVCSPEDVIGNGSLMHLVKMIDQRYNPILYHLPRTRDSSYEKMVRKLAKGPITNRELVSFTLKNLYWKVSKYPLFYQKDGTVKAWHPSPTPILKPDQAIVDLWATNWGKNWGFDNCLPYMMIEREYPWYLVPDSDLFFQIEVGGWVNFGPSGVPMNSPCCTWNMVKSHKGVKFFRPDGQGQFGAWDPDKLYTIWRPAHKIIFKKEMTKDIFCDPRRRKAGKKE